jgi:hypothetical protein
VAGTGASLNAAPARSQPLEAPSAALATGSGPAPVVLAEYASVRVIGPLQWANQADGAAVSGVVHNGGLLARTMVLTLILLDSRGERLGTTEAVLWDLAAAESRGFSQPLPPTSAPPTDVSARLDPLVP